MRAGQIHEQLGLMFALAQRGLMYGWHIIRFRRGIWQSRLLYGEGQNKPDAHVLEQDGRDVVEDRITLIIIAVSSEIQSIGYPKITAVPGTKRKLGSAKWNEIHGKMEVRKRDGESCPKNQQLCPASVGGGCCPSDRVCGVSDCLPPTSTTLLACGKENMFACALEFGGGCCPNGHECGRNGCTPLPGVAATMTCGPNSYLCPAAVNYGCCKIGMGCGSEECYSTQISTFTITRTITTTDDQSAERTFTTTITSTTTPGETTSQSSVAGVISKASSTVSTVPKTSATPTGSAGLSKLQLGGIIGGAIGLLLALIIATFIIIRRLNRAIEASETKSRARSSARTSAKGATSRARPSLQQTDIMSVDPLMTSPTTTEIGGTPRFSAQNSPYEADSSPVFRSPFSPNDPSIGNQHRGYNPVSTFDVVREGDWNRHTSIESVSTMQHGMGGGYFDIPIHDRRQSSQHSRQWSNASDQSQDLAELDAGVDGDRRASLQRALHGVGRLAGRRRTGSAEQSPIRMDQSPQHSSFERQRSDWTPPNEYGIAGTAGNRVQLGHTLGFIPEAGESRIGVDAGHFNTSHFRTTGNG